MAIDELTAVVLKVIRDNPNTDSHVLFDIIASEPDVAEARQNGTIAPQDILDVFEMLIDVGYVDGLHRITKFDHAYVINGLSQAGIDFMEGF